MAERINSSKRQSTFRRLPEFVLSSAAIVGLVLLVAGLFWSRVVPSQALWSQEQAQEYETAAVKLHEQSHSQAENGDEKQQLIISARQRFEEARQDLESARHARDYGGRYLSLFGSLLLGSSALGLYFRRQYAA